MPSLFEALEGDGLAHQRIGDGPRVSGHDRARSPLRMEHFLPKRDPAEALQRREVEIRPRQGGRIETTMARYELAAESLLVLDGSDLHAGAGAWPGVRMKRRISRIREGTNLGLSRRAS